MAKTFVSRGMEHDVHSKGQLFGHQSSTEVKPVQIPYPSVDPSPVSSSASVKKTHVGISSALNKAQLDGKKGINKMNSLGFARDITIPRGRDNKGNTLADICINGDTLEDDCIMLKNTTLLADVTTPYQRLEIVDTETYGRCMLLDRVTQFCESDNAIYTDQLITRAFDKFKPGAVARDDPIDPKINVQLVGGGDGWVPSAILDRYSDILGNMTAVDIDPVVSEMTQRYFRPAGKVNSFKDTRMNWIYTDAGAWLRDNAAARRASIDIFIIDCTDHTAMAAKILYTQEFYSNVFKMLKPGGIVVQQMNTDSPEYLKFFLEAERVWSSAGFKNLQKWSEYIPSFLGKSVFWMAQS